MDAKSFYGARQRNVLALVPEIPQDSDADLSDDDDQIEDPDYQPTQAEETLGTLLLNPWMRKRLPHQADLLHFLLARRAEKGRTP
ncbi:uncharacterized protein ACO6RY_15715 [Pungitius sinensis]